jgi:hypothetical protein
MLKAFPFGEWTPDLAPANSLHLNRAINVRPIANGYAPVKDFTAITDALAAAFKGAAAFVASDGDPWLLAGTATNLYSYSSGAFSSEIADGLTTKWWRFCQFGDNAIASNGGKLIAFDMDAGTAAEITDSPTNCIDVARVRDFVMVLTADDQAIWSEFNDSSGWTAGTNQSDTQPLLGGGSAVAIVGGEYGLIFQKNEIKRVSYVGVQGDIIFQFDTISPEIGCMAQGSVCNVGRLVFFLSERGFEMCDGQSVLPIADEKFNRWFFDTYSRAEIADITSAIDAQRSEVAWCMPGNPGRLIIYNWVLKRGATVELPVSAVFTGFTTSVTLESLDALYPSGIDSMDVSLDDPRFQGGSPALLAVNTSDEFGQLVGDNLRATVQLKNVEPSPGRRSRIRNLRPITDATSLTATVDARQRLGDAESVESAASLRDSGRMPIRSNGRYCDITLSIPEDEDWTFIQGVELEFEGGGAR